MTTHVPLNSRHFIYEVPGYYGLSAIVFFFLIVSVVKDG